MSAILLYLKQFLPQRAGPRNGNMRTIFKKIVISQAIISKKMKLGRVNNCSIFDPMY